MKRILFHSSRSLLLAAFFAVVAPSDSSATLILGLDARSITEADGTSVALWDSGVGSATQANLDLQPTYRAASANLNNFPAVDFDDQPSGADAISFGDGMTTTVTGLGADYTVLALYAYRGTSADASRVVQGGNGVRNAGGGAGANNWLIGPYNGVHQLFDGGFINSASSVTTPVIATAIGSAAVNEEFYLNGVLAGVNGGTTTPNNIGLGTEGAWAEPADSDVGLVLVFDNPLTEDERVGVEFQMAQAYGLPGFSATPEQLAAGSLALDGFLDPDPTAPSDIILSQDSFLPTLGVGEDIGTFSSQDVNFSDTHTYSLVSGTGDGDNARFQLSGDALQTASSFAGDGGSSFSIRVRSTDSDSLFLEKIFTISVVGDSDSDALPDAWELMFTADLGDLTGLASGPGPGPGTGDYDDDGSPDSEEIVSGTDPFDEDSDDDGSSDGEEAANNTDPLDEDTDDDGLNDGGEADAGSDPFVSDTDGDGLSDGEEVNGAIPTDPTLVDTDGDGSTDPVELAAGTNPNNPAEFPTSNATLILGLNAKDLVLPDGDPVASWDSGFGIAEQTDPLFQPTYRAASAFLNGMPAVDFNDSASAPTDGDGMVTTAVVDTEYSIFALYAYRATGTDAARVVQGGNGVRNAGGGAGANNWLIGPYNGTHQLYDGSFIPSGSNITTPVIASGLGSLEEPNEFFLNGASQGTNANNNAPNMIGLGTEGAWAEAADSDVGLVLVFDDRLTERERLGVEYFMAEEYGLEGFEATPAQVAAGAAVLGGFLTSNSEIFQILAVDYDLGGTEADVTWTSVAGATYILEYSDDLGGSWLEAEDGIPAGPKGTTTATHFFAPAQPVSRRYYRVLRAP